MSGESEDKIYQIRVNSRLDSRWSEWFCNMSISSDSEQTTTLTGSIPDDCALFGLLKKIHDMGLSLLSVNLIGTASKE